jgi:hypothetical protein
MTHKISRPEPIDLYAQVSVPRAIDASVAEIKEQLAYEIAEEIKDKKLYDFRRSHDFATDSIVYRMQVYVVEPLSEE